MKLPSVGCGAKVGSLDMAIGNTGITCDGSVLAIGASTAGAGMLSDDIGVTTLSAVRFGWDSTLTGAGSDALVETAGVSHVTSIGKVGRCNPSGYRRRTARRTTIRKVSLR